MPRYASMADRIIANSVQSLNQSYDGTPCWEWTGHLNNSGYPTMGRRLTRGPRKGQRVTVYAHHESVKAFTNRRVTIRTVVMHRCNNRACVNPAHLAGGTQRLNVQQCVKEGRHKTPFRDPTGAMSVAC